MVAATPISILIVEDDEGFRDTAARWMSRKGHFVDQAPDGQEALPIASRRHFDVAIVDMNMPGMTGMEVLEHLQTQSPDTEVIILTGQATVENAVEAMKLGACDYLTKPFPLADLERRCQLAAERGQLHRENLQLRDLLNRSHANSKMIGQSPEMQEVFRVIERVASTEKVVLIQGESGTGKELVARAIQEQSLRADRPLVTVNCASLPETLFESELFGHEKGAFTGATNRKHGLFEVADGGTLFVDEIGELPLSLQPKLLRVLEDGSLRRVGSHQERIVNVRVIAATNRDLQKEVEEGRFREDLYYRINVLSLVLPPLRDRTSDVPFLIDHFLGTGWELEDDARNALVNYHWPGNIRQLMNALDRATIMAEHQTITIDDLPFEIAKEPVSDDVNLASDENIEDLASVERAHILNVLTQEKGNKAKTARTLGIHRRKLYRLLDRYDIEFVK